MCQLSQQAIMWPRSIYKSIGTKGAYSGHFRAVQGFKYIGESDS